MGSNGAWSYYVMDRDDRRDPRPEDRSHFLNFGGLFFPNEAGRNCLLGSFGNRQDKTRMAGENKLLDEALKNMTPEDIKEYEELIELWITYGGS